MDEIRSRVEHVIAVASKGAVGTRELQAAEGNLIEAGLDSITILAVIMGLEAEFGITIDMNEDASFLMSLDNITAFTRSQMV